MLDESKDSGGHEPSGTHRRSATGHLGYLHDAAPVSDLYSSPISSGFDLIGQGGAAGVDDDLGAIALHGLLILYV
jgi:hypothetical protein